MKRNTKIEPETIERVGGEGRRQFSPKLTHQINVICGVRVEPTIDDAEASGGSCEVELLLLRGQ